MTDEPTPLYTRIWKDVESVQRYAEKRYKTLDQRIVSSRELSTVASLMDRHGIHSASVLDVPAGYGRFTQLFLEYDMRVFCADLNLFTMLFLRNRFLEATQTAVSSVMELPFPDSRFDLVFTFRLMQHFGTREKRLSALREMSRVTRQWVLASFYTRSWFHTFTRKSTGRKSGIVMQTVDSLIEESRKAGLELVEQVKILPGLHAQTICLFTKK